MIASLLLLAASALERGTSPMVEEGHVHRWEVFENDEEGAGWIDHAWRGETVLDGSTLKLVLMRVDIKGSEPMVGDLIIAADCERNLLGIKQGYLFEADFGHDMPIPVPALTMDFADNPPNEEDLEIIAFACEREGAAE